ncbi:hypothetical protein A9Q99_03855 [Gammaproteobacteria bacterium 45_16_T64]|nr:hypothetical protein A9Q99_03855 [Gammaproteobacteria bacterium 45_16_T64]
MTASLQQINPKRMALEGVLNRHTVGPLRADFSKYLKGADSCIELDLEKVGQSTSVGLSLLLCYVRKAKKTNKTLTLVNMPHKLFEMARVSGLDDVLPLG